MTEGKWTCSTDEEHWNCDQEFDTKEEALAYAMSEHAPDMGVEDGQRIYVGQVETIKLDALADSACDADRAIDNMQEWLYENAGEGAEDSLKIITKDAEADLDVRLTNTVLEWMKAYGIKPNYFLIGYVESHVWEQCKETDPTQSVEELRKQRCVLPIEHDGDCEWP
jgi:hypothetical protein